MSRKHFIAMANVIKLIADSAERKATAERAAQEFAASNARFDRARFLTACGVE